MSKPLKVLLVGNLPEDRQHSMLGFGAVLAERLPEEGLQVRLLQPEARLSRSVPKTSRLSKWVGYFDKLVLFRRTLMKEAASHDLVHVLDQGNGLYASWTASRFRTLVTCHDLLAFLAALGHIPGWTKGATGRRQQDMNMAGLRAAHHVACVSEQTLDDCRIHLEIPADRLSLVYNGPYRPLFPADDRVWRELSGRHPGLAAPYLFLLGSNAEYKNRGYGMKVFRELKASGELPDLRLVVAGQPIPEAVRTLAGEAASEVDEIVDPSNAEVAELHRHAAGLFWPSTHEGFGLPILEALAYGAPVFTLDRRPMTEVAGPAGFTFHDSDPAAAARDIIRAWPERSSRMIQAPDQVSRFSTEAMVEGYRSLYRRLA